MEGLRAEPSLRAATARHRCTSRLPPCLRVLSSFLCLSCLGLLLSPASAPSTVLPPIRVLALPRATAGTAAT
eukprot:5455529-Alexandrium_andersonii.AAC.1